MIRIIFFVLVGGLLGYFAGFNDAKVHREHIITRTIQRFTDPETMSNDIDKKMERLDR
jgi:hypothetical protein